MRSRRRHWLGLPGDDKGNTAVEFALVFPMFLAVIVGGFYVAQLAFAASSLHYAVEAGARCAAINSTTCSNNTTTASYARTRFVALGGNAPTFTSSNAACGHQVSGTMTFVIRAGVTKINVPLSAQSCFP